MAYYESVIIARQDISAAQVDALADELTEVVKTNGGEVAKREYWGLKNLSYRIKKNRKGHYVLLNLDAPAEAVAEYERIMRFNEDVIRYLTIRVKELDTNPSAMMQAKDSRGRDRDRGPRRDGDRGPRRDGDRDRGPRRDAETQSGGERS